MATFKQVHKFQKVNLGASNAGRALDAESKVVKVSLAQFTKISVHAVDAGSSAWSTAVLTLKVGNTDDDAVTIPGGSVTMTAPGATTQIDVTAYQWLILDVTTVQSNAAADIYVCGYGEK